MSTIKTLSEVVEKYPKFSQRIKVSFKVTDIQTLDYYNVYMNLPEAIEAFGAYTPLDKLIYDTESVKKFDSESFEIYMNNLLSPISSLSASLDYLKDEVKQFLLEGWPNVANLELKSMVTEEIIERTAKVELIFVKETVAHLNNGEVFHGNDEVIIYHAND